jgi:membrane associated rhomboid family serine protease
MGAYFVMYPTARVVTLIPILFYPLFIELPAFFFLAFWFYMQVFSGLDVAGLETGVAWWAHVGGFVAGMLTFSLFLRRRRARPGFP